MCSLKSFKDSENDFELLPIECGKGWYPLIQEAIDYCIKEDFPDNTNLHVFKEKFGRLRIYIDIDPDECGLVNITNDRISSLYSFLYDLEKKSSTTCEVCGKSASLVRRKSSGYLKTFCLDCRGDLYESLEDPLQYNFLYVSVFDQ